MAPSTIADISMLFALVGGFEHAACKANRRERDRRTVLLTRDASRVVKNMLTPRFAVALIVVSLATNGQAEAGGSQRRRHGEIRRTLTRTTFTFPGER